MSPEHKFYIALRQTATNITKLYVIYLQMQWCTMFTGLLGNESCNLLFQKRINKSYMFYFKDKNAERVEYSRNWSWLSGTLSPSDIIIPLWFCILSRFLSWWLNGSQFQRWIGTFLAFKVWSCHFCCPIMIPHLM